MIGLKNIYRALWILAVLFLTGVILFSGTNRKEERWILFAVPSSRAAFIKVDSSEFFLKGIDYTTIMLPQENLTYDTADSCYYYKDNICYSVISDSLLKVDFLPVCEEMSQKMGLYTDDINAHDYLYKLSLNRVATEKPFIKRKVQQRNLLESINTWRQLILANGQILCSYRRATRTDDLQFVSTDRIVLGNGFVYRDAVSNASYLIQRLSEEEKKMGLYYYPTALVGYDIEDSPYFVPVLKDSLGALCVIKTQLAFFHEGFMLIPGCGQYFRCAVYNFKEREGVDHIFETYLSDTERLNILIRKYYSLIVSD